MSGKSRELYEEAFNQLAQKVDKHSHRALRVKTIKADFELALRDALTTVFPTASVSGCQIHFMAAVNRQWRAKRPKTLSKREVGRFVCVFPRSILWKLQEEKALEFVARLKATSFLPESKIRGCVQRLCDELGTTLVEKLDNFIKYFNSTWLNRMLASWITQ